MFCTNGVLLRMLTHGDGLSDITHVRLCLPCHPSSKGTSAWNQISPGSEYYYL